MMIAQFPVSGRGDVIWIRGQDDPIYGRIESESEKEILVRVFESGALGQPTRFPREQVESLVINFDAKRLELLDPSKPETYRDYAEELAVQKNDPVARDLAQRLYLLAAANAEQSPSGDEATNAALQRSALLGLASLTESSDARRPIDMLRHLIDPAPNDVGPLATRDSASDPPSSADKQRMLELVRAIRREQTLDALRLLRSPENRLAFERWRKQCSLEELDGMARVNRPSQVQLGKLLSIETQIVRDEGSSIRVSRQYLNWGDFAVQVSNNLGVLPTFENITRFDPRKSVYRNGAWVEPPSK